MGQGYAICWLEQQECDWGFCFPLEEGVCKLGRCHLTPQGCKTQGTPTGGALLSSAHSFPAYELDQGVCTAAPDGLHQPRQWMWMLCCDAA